MTELFRAADFPYYYLDLFSVVPSSAHHQPNLFYYLFNLLMQEPLIQETRTSLILTTFGYV